MRGSSVLRPVLHDPRCANELHLRRRGEDLKLNVETQIATGRSRVARRPVRIPRLVDATRRLPTSTLLLRDKECCYTTRRNFDAMARDSRCSFAKQYSNPYTMDTRVIAAFHTPARRLWNYRRRGKPHPIVVVPIERREEHQISEVEVYNNRVL